MKIGILALQGAFVEHASMLEKLGVSSFEIRKREDFLTPMDGLIIPGGESTTMFRLLNGMGVVDLLRKKIDEGLPVFGTCAGLLMLAKDVKNFHQSFLKTMNVTAIKNAYGRQLGSFVSNGKFMDKEISMVFIRAPYIENTGSNVQVLAKHDGKIVAAREKNQLVTAFHPELTEYTDVHEYFLTMCKERI
jgi:5'-phosphate synthase pdxT subunit